MDKCAVLTKFGGNLCEMQHSVKLESLKVFSLFMYHDINA